MRANKTFAEFDDSGTEHPVRPMADPVAIISLNGLVIALNNAFLEFTGYGEDELAGKPLGLFTETPFDAVLAAGVDGCIDMIFRKRDGRRLALTASISSICGKEGFDALALVARCPAETECREGRALIGEVMAAREEIKKRIDYLEDFRTGILQMVKEIDRSEEELEGAYRLLKETRDQLVQSSKMSVLGELASDLAHELSQPVTIIKGLSQNMVESLDEGSACHEKVKLILHAIKKMESVIKHLRIFSRKDAPAMAPTDLNRVINEAFVMIKELLSSHAIEVRMDLKPLPLILGSPVRLEQVIINIVTNARDAMPKGGVLEIRTSAESAGGKPCAVLSISDSGVGIPADNLKRIFDPFFTTKEPGKGTGIGLSISYGIVKEHDGEITVESAPGRGTTFHITIPAANPPERNSAGDFE